MFKVFIESVCAVETHEGHSLKWKVRYCFERVLGHGTVKQRYHDHGTFVKELL